MKIDNPINWPTAGTSIAELNFSIKISNAKSGVNIVDLRYPHEDTTTRINAQIIENGNNNSEILLT